MNTSGLLTSRHSSQDDFADAGLDALLELEAAARILDLEDWIVERLRHPEYEETRSLLLRRDKGQAMTVPFVHVQHNTSRGIACGNLSLASDVFAPRLRSNAMHASWQHAVLGLPFGGAASALGCDARQLSERELQRVSDEFTKLDHLREHVAVRGDGMNECIAGWMRGASGCFVSGISEAAGGVVQERISAISMCEIIRHWCMQRGERFAGQRMAIQGFEGVGVELAEMLYRSGALLVAVADVSGGLVDPLGLNADALKAHVQRDGVLLEYPDAEVVSNADVLRAPCDVLVLADSTATISDMAAEEVKARLVIEHAPAVLSAASERSLAAREIEIVPAILAAAGAPLAAYMEYAQRGSMRWSNSRANAFVRRMIRHAREEVIASALHWNISSRHAAIALGVQRVAAAVRAKGF